MERFRLWWAGLTEIQRIHRSVQTFFVSAAAALSAWVVLSGFIALPATVKDNTARINELERGLRYVICRAVAQDEGVNPSICRKILVKPEEYLP